MKAIKEHKKLIGFIGIGLLIIAIITIAYFVLHKNPVVMEAKLQGYDVNKSMSIPGSPQGDSGVEIDYILPNGPYFEAITSYTLETEEEARDYYDRMKENFLEGLGDTVVNKKETKNSYLYEDENFYYLGSYKGKVMLQAAVDNTPEFKENYEDLRAAFEFLGYELPEE